VFSFFVFAPLLRFYQGDNSGGNPKTAPINDISTDTQNPPNFAAVIPLRPKGSNSIEYPQQSAAAQAAQFPDIKPITSTLDNIEAFNRALDIVRENGWEVIYQDSTSGVIEAVASTRFFNRMTSLFESVETAPTASSIFDHIRV